LPKEDAIEVMGKVVEKFKAGMFSIELEAGRAVLATMAGRLRRNRIKIMNGDRVTLELSPYDLTKGRITYRHKWPFRWEGHKPKLSTGERFWTIAELLA
jgi:translation initiation factor IF-1